MREVTIHVAPGQTDRDLERALLAIDPQAQVHRVSGRLGRTGVRVSAHLALLYLVAEGGWDSFVWHDHGTTVASPVAEVTITGVSDEATTTAAQLVAEAPAAAPAKPKKTATKKKTEEV